jgi:hypothetical protein
MKHHAQWKGTLLRVTFSFFVGLQPLRRIGKKALAPGVSLYRKNDSLQAFARSPMESIHTVILA